MDREKVQKEIGRASKYCGRCVLKGSWASGDFHYLSESRESYSDVDVYCPSGCKIGHGLISVKSVSHSLRISRRREPYAETLSLEDGALLAALLLGDLNYRLPGKLPYLHSKVGLLWLRVSTQESYSQVGERIREKDVLSALSVKLGGATSVQDGFIQRALGRAESFPWGEAASSLLLEGNIDVSESNAWKTLVRFATDEISSASNQLVADLIRRSLDRRQ